MGAMSSRREPWLHVKRLGTGGWTQLVSVTAVDVGVVYVLKAQQEEDDKMRAKAANVAARAAVGATDMLSKWQMMAAQGLAKRQGGDTGRGGTWARVMVPWNVERGFRRGLVWCAADDVVWWIVECGGVV